MHEGLKTMNHIWHHLQVWANKGVKYWHDEIWQLKIGKDWVGEKTRHKRKSKKFILNWFNIINVALIMRFLYQATVVQYTSYKRIIRGIIHNKSWNFRVLRFILKPKIFTKLEVQLKICALNNSLA